MIIIILSIIILAKIFTYFVEFSNRAEKVIFKILVVVIIILSLYSQKCSYRLNLEALNVKLKVLNQVENKDAKIQEDISELTYKIYKEEHKKYLWWNVHLR